MKRYKEYKDSEVAWLGQVPSHWQVLRLKFCLSQLTTVDNSRIFKVGLENIESNSGKFIATESVFDGHGVIFEKGDILYGKLRPYLRKVWIAIKKGNAVGDFYVFRPKKGMSSNYFKYFLLSDPFTDLVNGATEGAKMPRIGIDFIMNLKMAIPPLFEQQAIAGYLDRKCEAIDEIVGKINKKINLLQRMRNAIITHTVTKGLNQYVDFRLSGVNWVRVIPRHWKIVPFKSLGRMNTGINITKSDLTDEGVPVVSYGQIHSKNNNGVTIDDNLIRFVHEDMVKNACSAKVERGSFIFADTSEDLDGCGNAVYVDTDSAIYAGYHTILLHRKNMDGKFLAYLFKTDLWRSQIRSQVAGTKVYSITKSILKSCSVVLPPSSEQRAIACYLDRKCGKIDELVEKYKKQKELLERYRRALITQVVTGQKCVCKHQRDYVTECDESAVVYAAETVS